MINRFSKHISIILAAVIMLVCAFVPMSSVVAENNIWDGGTAGGAIQGGGSKDNPYLITNAEQLAWVISNGGNGRYYKLTADIYLNDVDKVDWATGEGIGDYTPKSWYTTATAPQFSGTIDGDGHVVYGLYYKDPTEVGSRITGYGLIPCGGNLVIKNLGVDKSYLEAYTNYSLGVFVGLGQGTLTGSIDSCYSGADVTLIGFDAGSIVGGGDIGSTLTIQNTYSLATVNVSHLGGMVGDIWTDEYVIKNSFAVGTKLTGKGYPNVISSYATVECNNGILLSAEDMKGSAVNGNQLALSDAFVATESYPVLKAFCDNARYSWNGVLHAFEHGSGTVDDPYIIEDAGQLANALNLKGGNFKLAKDIFINDIEQINWTTGKVKTNSSYIPNEWFYGIDDGSAYYLVNGVGSRFNGTIDGNGYAVHGLWYDSDNVHTTVGLVPAASGTTIKDLTLSNSYIYGGRFTGGISSYFAGIMSGCVVDSSVKVCGVDAKNFESESIGGLIGWSNGVTLTDCGFAGTLTKIGSGGHHIYGLIGTSWGTTIIAENCYSLAHQPFTTSVGSKNYATQADAEAGYSSLYKATNVYTDTISRANNVTYKYDSDGVDSNDDGKLEYDKSATYEVFTFNELNSFQMKSKEALENMTGLSAEKWYTREALAPIQKAYMISHGDVNSDGKLAEKADIVALRSYLIGNGTATYPDVTRNGEADICDLVSVNSKDTFVVGSLTVPTAVFLAEWETPEVISIIYPAGDGDALRVAKNLKAYYEEAGLTANLSDDSAATTVGEILLGDTNRAESALSLYENGFASKIVGSKVVINAGHNISLEEAVNAFVSVPYRDNAAPIFEGFAEFDSTLTLANGNTYSYVWGDEFVGDTLNRDKWVCSTGSSKMSGFNDMPILADERTVKVTEGRLRLSAIPYSVEGNDTIKYAVPASVHSQGTMEYRYGYIEIRAKVPFETGVWPSFWMQSKATLGGRQCLDYFVEVDVFEIFGSSNAVVPNLHKWYDSSVHDSSTHDCTYTGTHTASGTTNSYYHSAANNLDNEYHTYGFEWGPTEMSMYVDGTCYQTYDITKSYDACSNMDGFHDPMFVIFNNHLFSPLSSYKPNLITDNEDVIPAHYEIDYFRLYQSDEVENTDVWLKK